MAVRIRSDGTIVCAAMHPEEPGDTYLHDGISYRLSVELHVLVTDRFHLEGPNGEAGHGLWWWVNEVPEHIEVDAWWERPGVVKHQSVGRPGTPRRSVSNGEA